MGRPGLAGEGWGAVPKLENAFSRCKNGEKLHCSMWMRRPESDLKIIFSWDFHFFWSEDLRFLRFAPARPAGPGRLGQLGWASWAGPADPGRAVLGRTGPGLGRPGKRGGSPTFQFLIHNGHKFRNPENRHSHQETYKFLQTR